MRLAKGGCSAAAGCRTSLLNPSRKLSVSKNSFASSALGGRTRFAAASTNQRSVPAACSAAAGVPNVAFESNMQKGYRSRGGGQPQKLRFPRFSRPHSFVHSEHQPKECAGSRKQKERKETKKNKKKGKERRLVRYRAERARAKGKGEGCHSHAPTLNEHSPSAFPLQAGGSADYWMFARKVQKRG